MKKKTYLLILPLIFLACAQDQPQTSDEQMGANAVTEVKENQSRSGGLFDDTKWRIKVGPDYPFRNNMVEDLMNNQGLRNLRSDEIVELLGEPDRTDNGHLFYRINQTRVAGLWPLHTKTMVIQLAEDSTVNWIKIHE